LKSKLNGTHTKKSDFFGTCSICGQRNKKLATTQTSIDGMIYWIKKACQHCHDVLQNEIHHAIVMIRADVRQLEEQEQPTIYAK
jgi:NMD protein affecting ribosome stability and mRNA decay